MTRTQRETRCSAEVMKKALYFQLFLIVLLAGSVHAQDLQPRAFSPAPTGLNTVLVGYSNSQGNVFFDQALLIEDATGEVHGVTSAYVRTLGIFGKLAKFSTVIPIAWGELRDCSTACPRRRPAALRNCCTRPRSASRAENPWSTVM